MKRIDLAKRGFRNLRRNKSRSVLTILALSIGAITLVLTLGVGNALTNTVDIQLDDATNLVLSFKLEIEDKEEATGVSAYDPDTKAVKVFQDNPGPDDGGEIQLITKEQIDELAKISGVARVWPSFDEVSLKYIQLIDAEEQFVIDNVSEQSYNEIETVSGIYPAEWEESDIVLSDSYADSFGLSIDEMIGKEVIVGFYNAEAEIQEKTYTIKGVVESGGGFGRFIVSDTAGIVTLSIDTLTSIYEAQYIGMVDFNEFVSGSILMENADVETQLRDDIMAVNEQFALNNVSELAESFTSVFDTITLSLAGFSGIALLAAAFGIINTQLMSVYERTKEIGLLKALGMPNKNVRRLFSYEAIIIGVVGALVGTVIALGVQEFVNNIFSAELADIGFINGIINLSIEDILMVVIGLGLLSWIAGVIPARKAQKLDPIQALKKE